MKNIYKTIVLLYAIFCYLNQAKGQSSSTGTATISTPNFPNTASDYLGWSTTSNSTLSVPELTIQNEDAMPISFYTNAGTGFSLAHMRMWIYDGGGGSNNGYIGIGDFAAASATPQNLLHIHNQNAATSFTQWTNTTTSAANVNGLIIGMNGSVAEINQQETANLEVSTGGSLRMTVAGGSGNVGIGTSPGVARLRVDNDIDIGTTYEIGGQVVMSVAGTQNLLLGVAAGLSLSGSPGSNTFAGYNAGNSATSARDNTFVGSHSGETNVTGDYNTYLGSLSGSNTTSDNNTFLGHHCGFNVTTGHDNTFVGAHAGYGSVTVGTGSYNTFCGIYAGDHFTTGYENCLYGYYAGRAITTGSDNVIIGMLASRFIDAGSNNVFVGNRAGINIHDGNDNTYLGDQATNISGTDLSNSAAIGANTVVRNDDQMILGNNSMNVGIGLSNDASGPQNKLEIKTGVSSTSGLTFRNLTSASTTGISPYGKVLTVDGSGTVVLTDDVGGGNVTSCGGSISNYIPKFTSATNLCKSSIWEDNSGDYNVGIGTASPISKLHTVAGYGLTTSVSYIGNYLTNVMQSTTPNINKTGLAVESTGTWSGSGTAHYGVNINAVGGDTVVGLKVNVSNANLLYSATFSGGRVGIGTTAPKNLLHVHDGLIQLTNASTGYSSNTMGATIGCTSGTNELAISHYPTAGWISIKTDDGGAGLTEKIRVACTGHTSIGSTSGLTNNQLYVEGNDGGESNVIYAKHTSTGSSPNPEVAVRGEAIGSRNYSSVGNIGGYFVGQNVTGGSTLNCGVKGEASGATGTYDVGLGGYFTCNSGYHSWGVYATASNGTTTNYGVYASATSGSTANYGVYGDANSSAATNIGGKFTTSGAATLNYGIHASAGNTCTGCPGVSCACTDAAGYFSGVVFSTVGYNVSDGFLKDNVQPVNNATSILAQLSPKTYDFKTQDYPSMHLPVGNQFGLISEDVEQVLPELVRRFSEPEVRDSLDNIIYPQIDFKALNYTAIIPILIAGFKEQQTQIQNLQAQLDGCCTGNRNSGSAPASGSIELENVNTLQLLQNDPNPFSESTFIRWTLPDQFSNAVIYFYDNNGSRINTYEIKTQGKGELQIFGSKLSNGIYTYSLIVDGKVIDTKKMVKN